MQIIKRRTETQEKDIYPFQRQWPLWRFSDEIYVMMRSIILPSDSMEKIEKILNQISLQLQDSRTNSVLDTKNRCSKRRDRSDIVSVPLWIHHSNVGHNCFFLYGTVIRSNIRNQQFFVTKYDYLRCIIALWKEIPQAWSVEISESFVLRSVTDPVLDVDVSEKKTKQVHSIEIKLKQYHEGGSHGMIRVCIHFNSIRSAGDSWNRDEDSRYEDDCSDQEAQDIVEPECHLDDSLDCDERSLTDIRTGDKSLTVCCIRRITISWREGDSSWIMSFANTNSRKSLDRCWKVFVIDNGLRRRWCMRLEKNVRTDETYSIRCSGCWSGRDRKLHDRSVGSWQWLCSLSNLLEKYDDLESK